MAYNEEETREAEETEIADIIAAIASFEDHMATMASSVAIHLNVPVMVVMRMPMEEFTKAWLDICRRNIETRRAYHHVRRAMRN